MSTPEPRVRLLGPFVTPWSLKRAARELLLSERLGIYVDEIVRQQTPVGRPVLRIDRPRDVVIREQARRRTEDQLPLIVLACPGSVDVRHRASDGTYTGTLRLEVHAVTAVSGDDVGAETASLLALGAANLLLHELPRATGFQVRWLGVLAGDPPELEGDGDAALDGHDDRLLHAEGHVLAVSGVLLSDLGGPLPLDLRDPPLEDLPADPGELPSVEEIALTTTPVEEIDP
ncbi:hypothetical protein [Conexibacter woesei]|uniref:Uncharacterized protein n=1 Tax=Conexibacter woesei (strain DSM 14684 / CCUG 47730 / CIP 108061 / JCM 11494 / NBRC 100937 / ID131577) TaxID=469383 RepID=D3F1Y8_CONWI|nr:hypothetical protein [Conexibacter woesei]ADB50163.1 hypothetical protein Cwoe_1736 [Conexibacter woesei DSM 14684]